MPDARKVRVKIKKKTIADDRRYMSDARKRRTEARRLKELQSLELRAGGATYEDISRALNLSDRGQAKKYVNRALEKFEIEAARSVVKLDLARIDEYIMRCTHALRTNGDLNQIDRLLRLMEFRYRLLGINSEDVRTLQSEHGIHTTVNNKNTVMVVHPTPETENEFISKMMQAVGVNPQSPAAQKYLEQHNVEQSKKELPMLKGSANERDTADKSNDIDEAEIIDAEIVDE